MRKVLPPAAALPAAAALEAEDESLSARPVQDQKACRISFACSWLESQMQTSRMGSLL